MATETQTPFLSPRALVHVGVFAVLLVLVLVTRGQGERAGIRELSLPSLAKERVTSIEIGGKHKAKLSREGDSWFVEDPDKPGQKFPAEQSQVDRALDGLAELEAGAFVTGRADKHDELELSAEKGTFVTAVTDDKKILKVVLGRFAKGGGNYLRKQDGDEVFVGKGALASAVRKDAAAWRKKALVAAEEKDLVEVRVAVAGQAPYVLTRAPAENDGDVGDWKLTEPATLPDGFRLDEGALGRLARAFAGLRAADFVDEKMDEAATGLGAGATVVTAKTQGGQEVAVRFGSADDKKRAYTTVSGDPQLYVVADYTVKNVAKPLDDLRDLTFLVGLDADKVTEARFDGPEGVVVLKKSGEEWTVAQGTPTPEFDATSVTAKLKQLASLKGQGYRGRGAEGGFVPGKPPVKVTLTVDGEAAPRFLEFGGEVPGEAADKPSGRVFARTSDGYVYDVGTYQKTRYEKPWDLFKQMAPPPGMGGMPGGGGGIPGLENLPPDIRRQLEQQLRQQGR